MLSLSGGHVVDEFTIPLNRDRLLDPFPYPVPLVVAELLQVLVGSGSLWVFDARNDIFEQYLSGLESATADSDRFSPCFRASSMLTE